MPSRLAREYQRRQARLAGQAHRQVGVLWGGVSAAEFVARAAEVDMAVEAAAVTLADAYMADYLTAVTGEAVPPLGVDPRDVGRRVPHEERWQRPAKHARMAASRGTDPRRAGLAYAQQLVRTDALLAARDTWHLHTSTDSRVVGYRRVLAAGKNCDLCVSASTQRYHSGELSPIHGNCMCSVEPIVGDRDPGQVIESQQRLEDPDTQLVVRDHGELGPTLTDGRHEFTGPDDLAA